MTHVRNLWSATFDFRRHDAARLDRADGLESVGRRCPHELRRSARSAREIDSVELFDDVFELMRNQFDEVAG